MDEKHLIGTIVSNLLYTEAAQDKLTELIWAEFTEDQRKALADAAHQAAMSKMESIVSSRLFALGSGGHRPNLFASHVSKVVQRVFDSEKVADTIKAVVQEHLDEALAGVKDQVKGLVEKLLREVLTTLFQNINVYALRDSVSAAFAKEVG